MEICWRVCGHLVVARSSESPRDRPLLPLCPRACPRCLIYRVLKTLDEGFTGRTMMQVGVTVAGARTGSRLGRLPFVLLLTLGLLVSLIRCAGCDLDFANANAPTVAMNLDQDSAPDTPEQQLPCHHCLSHVTAQQVAAMVTPADLIPRAPSFGQEQSPPALAGLPLFKPPRA